MKRVRGACRTMWTWACLAAATLPSGGCGHEARRATAPPEAVAAHVEGLRLAEACQWEDAIAAYEKAISVWPAYAEAHLDLGWAHSQTGDHLSAIKAYDDARRLNPDCPDVHAHLGASLEALGRWEDAARHFALALKADPNHRSAALGLGYAYIQLKNWDAAVQAMQDATRLRPEDGTAHFFLGVAYVHAGNTVAAEAQYEVLLPLDPQLADNLRTWLRK